jgi:hypothetical protein
VETLVRLDSEGDSLVGWIDVEVLAEHFHADRTVVLQNLIVHVAVLDLPLASQRRCGTDTFDSAMVINVGI